jgi:putative membrane protein (TIGR04086 family)
MNTLGRIRWVRVLVGGFLAEVSVFVVVIPVYLTVGQRGVSYAALAGSLVCCFLWAMWMARRVESQFILHGILVGAIATLLYVGLSLGRPEPAAYLVAHVLKIVGGAAGGFFAGRRRVVGGKALQES